MSEQRQNENTNNERLLMEWNMSPSSQISSSNSVCTTRLGKTPPLAQHSANRNISCTTTQDKPPLWFEFRGDGWVGEIRMNSQDTIRSGLGLSQKWQRARSGKPQKARARATFEEHLGSVICVGQQLELSLINSKQKHRKRSIQGLLWDCRTNGRMEVTNEGWTCHPPRTPCNFKCLKIFFV